MLKIPLERCPKCGGLNLSIDTMCSFCFTPFEKQSKNTFLGEYNVKQQENIEKAKILFGEEYVKESLENSYTIHTFHFTEPYQSMSLKKLKKKMEKGKLAGIKVTDLDPDIKKAKIILGEEFVKRCLEKDPQTFHRFCFPTPYQSMSLKKLKKNVKKGDRRQFSNSVYWSSKAQHNYIILGQYREAFVAATKAIELDPNYSDSCFAKAKVDERMKESIVKTMESVNRVLELVPNHRGAKKMKKWYEPKIEETLERIKKCDDLLKLNPSNTSALFDKGYAFLRIHDRENALKCFDGVLDIDPNHARATARKGSIMIELGNNKEGLKYIKRSIEIDPNYPFPHEMEALLYFSIEQYKEALNKFNIILNLKPVSKIGKKLKPICERRIATNWGRDIRELNLFNRTMWLRQFSEFKFSDHYNYAKSRFHQ